MTPSPQRHERSLQEEYAAGESRPLRGYVVTLSTYGTLVAGLTALARKTGRRPPERVAPFDVLLLAVATHKVSRLISKGSVTSPLRAPFTRYQHPTGESEVSEQVRGEGVRHALGEFLSCPFCLAVWVGTGFSAGLVFAPRLTRLAAIAFTSVAGSDFLQLLYDRTKRTTGGE